MHEPTRLERHPQPLFCSLCTITTAPTLNNSPCLPSANPALAMGAGKRNTWKSVQKILPMRPRKQQPRRWPSASKCSTLCRHLALRSSVAYTQYERFLTLRYRIKSAKGLRRPAGTASTVSRVESQAPPYLRIFSSRSQRCAHICASRSRDEYTGIV